jgi:hypothetical protein
MWLAVAPTSAWTVLPARHRHEHGTTQAARLITHGDRQPVRGREAHGGLNVPRVRRAHDHGRMMGEGQVVGGALPAVDARSTPRLRSGALVASGGLKHRPELGARGHAELGEELVQVGTDGPV